jgi:peptide/nickel transport system substrate-binding protein
VLVRNPHFWKVDKSGRRLPYLLRLVFLSVPDQNAAVLRFLAGESHLLDPVRPEDVAAVSDAQQRGGHQVTDLGPDIATNCIWFNLKPGTDAGGAPYVAPFKRTWFEDVRFRRAISHAMNREAMVSSVLQRQGDAQYNLVSPANQRWHNPAIPRFEFDPVKARALLDEMGLKDRDGDGVREDAQGRKVEFTILTNAANNTRVKLATVAKSMLADVGVAAAVQPIEFNTLVTTMRQTHRFEAILLGFTSGVPPEPSLSANVYRSAGVMHIWDPEQSAPRRPWEAEIDGLMDRAVTESDYATRKQAFDRVQQLMGEQQPVILLARERVQVAIRNSVKNVRPNILRPHVLWNPAELYLQGAGGPARR